MWPKFEQLNEAKWQDLAVLEFGFWNLIWNQINLIWNLWEQNCSGAQSKISIHQQFIGSITVSLITQLWSVSSCGPNSRFLGYKKLFLVPELYPDGLTRPPSTTSYLGALTQTTLPPATTAMYSQFNIHGGLPSCYFKNRSIKNLKVHGIFQFFYE